MAAASDLRPVAAGVPSWLRGGLMPDAKRLRQLHHALFALFEPAATLAMPAEQRDELRAAEQAAWQSVCETPDVQGLMALLDRLRWLSAAPLLWAYHRLLIKSPAESAAAKSQARAALNQFLKETGTALGQPVRSLVQLNRTQAQALFDLLLQSPLTFHRRLACGLRIFYIRCIYQGRMGGLVAGIGEAGSALPEVDRTTVAPSFTSPLRYDARSGELRGELDYIVVGSGPAGCVVAHQLQAAGKKVLVLESGPFFAPGTCDGRAGLDFYEGKGFRSTMDGGIFVLNGAVVGGGATVNVDMAFPPDLASVQYRFDQWRAQRQIPEDLWNPDELGRAHAWVERQFSTRQVAHGEINRHNRILFDGAHAHGRQPSLYRLNTYEPGMSPHAHTDKRGPVEALLLPALADANNPATLIPNARVTRLRLEGSRASGVEFVVEPHAPRAGLQADPCGLGLPPHQPIRVSAKQVVLAAGTLGSSAVLLNSRVANANIGRGFVMHPFMLVFGLFDDDVSCHVGTPSSVYVGDYLNTASDSNAHADFLIESASARPEIGALLLPGGADNVYRMLSQYRHLGGIGVLLIDSVSHSNRIGVDRQGRAEVHYALSEADKRRFRFGMGEGVQIMRKAGAKKVILPTHEAASDDAVSTAAALDFTPNKTPLFAAHIMAGNKLGVDAANSVISPQHRVWGLDNVFVVDNSVFPASVGANPMQTIYTMAKVFCERHLAACH